MSDLLEPASSQYSIGVCCGASTLTVVKVQRRNGSVTVDAVESRRHEADPKQVLSEMLERLVPEHEVPIAVTGRNLRHIVNLSSISEPEAVETALKYTGKNAGNYDAVISAGGETFVVYKLDRRGKIDSVNAGNKCASGTGEFFLQQLRRMDVSLERAMEYSSGEQPYDVSGRCSVFCKSDCTHATNKGVPKGQVIAGLSRMMASKVIELLYTTPHDRVLLIGGTAQNRVLAGYLEQEINELDIPKEATYFEAFGAACWAFEHSTQYYQGSDSLFIKAHSQFDFHKPLPQYANMVTFAPPRRGTAADGDECILGMDVGSTTTKAVLLRESDNATVASEYLRTNGDPIGAARECYRSLLRQIEAVDIHVRGFGVTGSGRKIVGLHGQTGGIINEIIAHAAAAVFFDDGVDTIFEIGGQDAKYTYITAGVASDYAMNEACSAGTGSFLEESAYESLGIEMSEIASWALKGKNPPNFNDQCAAFISSDIKNAQAEGLAKEDITAGLVYSICMNYVNRVKAARPVGNKVFMQGGVCYNAAVPLAMAALTGKRIVVPPEPGLAGAFGVCLEVKSRMKQGLLDEISVDLAALANREISYLHPFTCNGGKEKCDLGCSINRIRIEGKTYPFGGSCNRYYNLRHHKNVDAEKHDLVALRQKLVFETYAPKITELPNDAPTVGINRSFAVNTYYPLFGTFFSELGFVPVLPDNVDPDGQKKRRAPFCYPCEIAHGTFSSLLEKKPDYLFLPHMRGIKVDEQFPISNLCPLVQGEPFYLKGAFEEELSDGPTILTPMIDFKTPIKRQQTAFVEMALSMGVAREKAVKAFEKANGVQESCRERMLEIGRDVIAELEADAGRKAVVLFGRPYNAFAPEAHKGVPHKFASRGITVIPVDFLDAAHLPVYDHMYWSMGQMNLKGAELVLRHPQLFGTYITNFSCGPDSFIIGYFRDLMEDKPSLTLEMDDHTADAGLETRVEAFLDIVDRYRILAEKRADESRNSVTSTFEPWTSRLVNGSYTIEAPDGDQYTLRDSKVKLLLPSMGRYSTHGLVAACRRFGVRAESLPFMDESDLAIGKGNSLCKECLPLQLTTGALLNYLAEGRPDDELTVYFMPTASGPCRFGQYRVFMQNLIKKKEIPRVTLMSLSAEDNYGGLGAGFVVLGWYGTFVADLFQDIRHAMLVNAVEPELALEVLDSAFEEVRHGLEMGRREFFKALRRAAAALLTVQHKKELTSIPRVLLVGEIYVRQEDIARRWLPEFLAKQGIITHVAPLSEWVYYVNWVRRRGDKLVPPTLVQRIKDAAVYGIMNAAASRVRGILSKSGWYSPVREDVNHLMKIGGHFMSTELYGEAILTTASPLAELGRRYCGAIAIGPFGCMPNRLSEALLTGRLDRKHLAPLHKDSKLNRIFEEIDSLPFFSIESDGNQFPQIINARLETFILQAKRLHNVMIFHDGV